MTNTFYIQEKIFLCDHKVINKNNFEIKSVPRNYTVNFDEQEDPFIKISHLLFENKKNILLIDQKIIDIYKPRIEIGLNRVFAIPATEGSKTLESVTKILDFLQQHEFTKGEKLIVVGGGIIQEIGAFSGAIYKRGIDWIYFPTTLLSMSDSCLGGKASMNYKGIKNQLGLFSTPSEIYINVNFLKTLSESEIYSGLGEILKLCIIGGDYFITLYKENISNGKIKAFKNLKQLIAAALTIKKAIIEEDEFELDHRRGMNYGHTIGHAIESLSNYVIPHGQAVVVGMILANIISYQNNLLCNSECDFLNSLCRALINDHVYSCLKKIKLETLGSFLKKDKKTLNDQTTFVLIRKPGETFFLKFKIDNILSQLIEKALSDLLKS